MKKREGREDRRRSISSEERSVAPGKGGNIQVRLENRQESSTSGHLPGRLLKLAGGRDEERTSSERRTKRGGGSRERWGKREYCEESKGRGGKRSPTEEKRSKREERSERRSTERKRRRGVKGRNAVREEV